MPACLHPWCSMRLAQDDTPHRCLSNYTLQPNPHPPPWQVCPKNPHNFNVDNVRVVKIVGGAIHDSTVVNGMVLKRDAEGTVKEAKDAKVAVYAQAVDTAGEGPRGGGSEVGRGGGI